MASTLAHTVRTPYRPAEPVTLVEALKARQREYEALDALLLEMIRASDMPSEAFAAEMNKADRRTSWAYQRLNETEQKIAELPRDSERRERLCLKAYGCPSVPVGMGNVYESGALAYIEDYAPLDGTYDDGPRYILIPCKVVKVSDQDVMVKITADRPGYAKGETITTALRDAIPRDRIESPKSSDYVINGGWIWAQD